MLGLPGPASGPGGGDDIGEGSSAMAVETEMVETEAAGNPLTAAALMEFNAAGQIEPEDGPGEEDEFLAQGWDATSSNASTSVTSSVYAHTYENGRRYHAYKHGRYPIPNDDLEQDREDMKHAAMMELTDGKLFYAPLPDNPQKILDVGTGTGIWAIEIGDLYPSASVLGLDLSPIQPQWVPPNVRFMIDDVEDEWVHGSSWDFIHLRGMTHILRDMQKLIDQSFTHLRPGGWIEFQDTYGVPMCDDGTMKEDDTMALFYEECKRAGEVFGYDVGLCARVGEFLERAGFTQVTLVRRKIPLGPWAKDKTMRICGLYTRELVLHSLPSVLAKPFDAIGVTEVGRQVWAAKVKATLNESGIHRYYYYYFWYAQKPVSSGI